MIAEDRVSRDEYDKVVRERDGARERERDWRSSYRPWRLDGGG